MAGRKSGRGNSGGELGPLPGGRHGLSRRQVVESQRERLLAALAQLVAERGYRATTIAAIVSTASVSGNVFYEHFSSKEDCFLAAFDAVDAHLRELIAGAVAEEPDWPAQVVGALRAAEELLGGLAVLLARSALAGEGGALESRLPDLIDFTLAPYLGAGPARRLAATA